MKSRFIVVFSVALNLVLVGAICHFALRPAELKPVLREVRDIPASEPAPVTVVETNSEPEVTDPGVEKFSWAQLVSLDFKVYRDRLRSIECPEATVRDIIIAEINEVFRPKRTEILAAAQSRYWELSAKGKKALEEVETSLEKLDEEHQALIDEVLGRDVEDEESERKRQTQSWERHYSWLPADKRSSLIDLELEFRKRTQAVWEEVGNRPNPEPLPQDREKVRALGDELAEARKRLMSPEEFLEYRLRDSSAGHWGGNLPGFESTETEWRAVSRLKLDYEEALRKALPPSPEMDETFARRYGLPVPNASETARREEVLQQMAAELNKAMKSALGTERFAEYQLASSSDYQQTKLIIDRYELPESLARQAYELQRTASTHAEATSTDVSLTPEARLNALAAIRKETERALATTLGPKVFSTYQEYHGGWLQNLDQIPEE